MKVGTTARYFVDTVGELRKTWLAPDTRIFSSLAGARLCDTIGHYMYLFKRLMAVSAGRFYRFEHIVTHSSGKVLGKVAAQRRPLSPKWLALIIPLSYVTSAWKNMSNR